MKTHHPFTLYRFQTIDSTNAEALRLALAHAPDNTCIWAQHQSKGRGRQGRTWQSPYGNLYCSLLIRHTLPPTRVSQLSFVTALSVSDTVNTFLPEKQRCQVKWPNDVLVKEKKLCGILLENEPELFCTIIGIGINVNTLPDEKHIQYPITSLCSLLGYTPPLENILETLLHSFTQWRTLWQSQGFATIRQTWLQRAFRWQERIGIRTPHTHTVEYGQFVTLDDNGSLGFQPENQHSIQWITSGEILCYSP